MDGTSSEKVTSGLVMNTGYITIKPKGRVRLVVCERCNAKLSFSRAYMWGERVCESCERQMYYEKAKQEYQTRMDLEMAERERIRALSEAKAGALTELVSNGHDMFMYKSVYVPVDSLIRGQPLNGSFDISPVQALGLEGWEVAGIIPKTTAIHIDSGGAGGNVAGVYFIMKKRVSQTEPLLAERISEYVHSLSDWVKTGESPDRCPDSVNEASG